MLKVSIRSFILTAFACVSSDLIAAATAHTLLDKREFPLLIYNLAVYDVEVLAGRVDPLRTVIPVQSKKVASEEHEFMPIDCLSLIIVFPKIKRMITVDKLIDLKKVYFDHVQENYVDIRLIVELSNNEKKARLTAQLIENQDKVIKLQEYEVDTVQLASQDEIRTFFADACKDYLPEKEGQYILGQRKYLRHSR